ncbi:hypothetical protein HAX54_037156, partial [Datura stramonium]|nr:hypothetical protein [Datura stramonium]
MEAARCGLPEMAGKNGEKGKRMGREWRRLVALMEGMVVVGGLLVRERGRSGVAREIRWLLFSGVNGGGGRGREEKERSKGRQCFLVLWLPIVVVVGVTVRERRTPVRSGDDSCRGVAFPAYGCGRPERRKREEGEVAALEGEGKIENVFGLGGGSRRVTGRVNGLEALDTRERQNLQLITSLCITWKIIQLTWIDFWVPVSKHSPFPGKGIHGSPSE